MDKKYWRIEWLKSLNELSSTKLQQTSWLNEKETNPHYSFIEFINQYFNDLFIDNNYEYQIEKKWISKKEFSIINCWHINLSNYNSPQNKDYDHLSILNDKNWIKLVDQINSIKPELSKELSTSEQLILNKKLNYSIE